MRHKWQNRALDGLVQLWQDFGENGVEQERVLVQNDVPVLNRMDACVALPTLHRVNEWD